MVAHRLAFLDKYSLATKSAGFGGICILLVAIACHILCMSTPYYFTLSNSAAKEVIQGSPEVQNFTFGIHYGLWVLCVHSGNDTSPDQCYQIANSTLLGKSVEEPDWLVPPRVLAIVGLLVAVAGVMSIIAFALTTLDRLPQLFLASAAVTSIAGGILILSSDIAFAAEKTIAFYAETPMESYFFPTETPDDSGEARLALRTKNYDSRFASGWSFILDLVSGVLCVVAGPCFVFVAWRLQLARDIKNRTPEDPNTLIYQGRNAESRL